jgi:hypothetical protein
MSSHRAEAHPHDELVRRLIRLWSTPFISSRNYRAYVLFLSRVQSFAWVWILQRKIDPNGRRRRAFHQSPQMHRQGEKNSVGTRNSAK